MECIDNKLLYFNLVDSFGSSAASAAVIISSGISAAHGASFAILRQQTGSNRQALRAFNHLFVDAGHGEDTSVSL